MRTSQCALHTLIRTFSILSHWHWLKVKGICVAHFSKTHFRLVVMSLLNIHFVRFPPVASSPTCSLSRPSASSTSLERSRINLCASAQWSGMSGPTPLASGRGSDPTLLSRHQLFPVHRQRRTRKKINKSSSSWSPSPTWWSSSSRTQSWQKWHPHRWQDDKWSEQW